jgi:Fe-S cluster assembly protein SufB
LGLPENPPIDFQEVIYYAAPEKKQLNSLDEVDPELLETFNKLGIPLEEQKSYRELLLMR